MRSRPSLLALTRRTWPRHSQVVTEVLEGRKMKARTPDAAYKAATKDYSDGSNSRALPAPALVDILQVVAEDPGLLGGVNLGEVMVRTLPGAADARAPADAIAPLPALW